MSDSSSNSERKRTRGSQVRRVLREVTSSSTGLIHPALIPGIGVERTQRSFATNVPVFVIAGAAVVGVIAWAAVAPDTISTAGNFLLAGVTTNFGWLFGLLAIAIAVYMLILGYTATGGIRLGADHEKPEFSTVSWIAMLFSAGMGIGLLFYGPYEPLTYFMDPPHGMAADPETVDAMHAAMAQVLLHWGPIAWAFYALVGGSIAYNAYRRGRSALISSIFEPIFGKRTEGPLGAAIDIFAIIVTLFGTAISLGIGALQIGQGYQAVSGAGPVTNTFLIVVMVVLTCAFIFSAVSGVKRGIRALSNINMVLAGLLALFVFIVGPTVFLLNFIPAGILDFFRELGTMLVRNPNEGPDTAAFMASWTTYYWAWWVSWTPFVGLFIAKISRGRTLREFVTVVVLIPALVCAIWFGIFGGTAMFMEFNGVGLTDSPNAEALLFGLLGELPFASITSIIAMISIIIFFVTSADSASIVMGSMSQRGRPDPAKRVTILWGVLLGGSAMALLLAGGEDALSGLQSLMMVSALPFAFVVIGIMIAWARDLYTDPFILRKRYANTAIAQGVRRAIVDHGDDFVFEASHVDSKEGAGAWLDTEDPALVNWYLEATGELTVVDAEDVLRTMRPGRIQPKGEPVPEHTASGEYAMITARRHHRERNE